MLDIIYSEKPKPIGWIQKGWRKRQAKGADVFLADVFLVSAASPNMVDYYDPVYGEELVDEIERLRADAERYRFHRARKVAKAKELGLSGYTNEMFDEYTDAAMKEQKE